MPQSPNLFTPKDLCRSGVFPLGDQTLRNYVKSGKVKATHIGNRFYFDQNQIEELRRFLAPHAPTNGNTTIN